jgi:hypothetical protein
MPYWSPCLLHCSCGWEKTYRNPVAAQWGGEAHLPHCSFYLEAQKIIKMVDFNKHLKGQTMATKNKIVDDPFEDDWGMPEAQTQAASDEMPEASGDEKPPFLKPHHVGTASTGTLELLSVTSETSDYSDVIFLVKFRDKKFRLGMKLFAADYKALQKRFGNKKADWHGQLRYKVMPHRGNPQGYIAVR